LRGNLRLLWIVGLVCGCALVFAVGLAIFGVLWQSTYPWVAGAGIAAISLWAVVDTWRQQRARLAYTPGYLIVRLGRGSAERIAIDAVECFLLGRGPAFPAGHRLADRETINLIVRLRQDSDTLRQGEIDRRLGTWCDYEITIRGTWCEPLSVELVTRLNARLAETQAAQN
jgi:hypothetical protein